MIEQVEVASKILEGLSADIYTTSLRQLKEASQDLQAVAKSSGAGGGDCGITLSFDVQSTETLKNRWADLGIELLYQERIGHDDKFVRMSTSAMPSSRKVPIIALMRWS